MVYSEQYVTLVGGWATPLKNMSSSIGMMKFPTYGKIWENRKWQPNHQPDTILILNQTAHLDGLSMWGSEKSSTAAVAVATYKESMHSTGLTLFSHIKQDVVPHDISTMKMSEKSHAKTSNPHMVVLKKHT